MAARGAVHARLDERQQIDACATDVPLGRVGAPADIAEAVAFLASDAAGCITGDNLVACGGMGVHARP